MTENGPETESTEAEIATSVTPESPEQIEISPDRIRPNPNNPRQFFRPETIQQLADSIQEVGILVPLTVYREEEGSDYILLDGERRWRAAMRINYPEIPAWVIQRPDDIENTVLMFNIHMLREEWPQIAAAWALEDLMERSGATDNSELSQLTGVSQAQIRNMKRALRFPGDWQQKVASGDLPFNFLVELDKSVLRWTRQDPEAVQGFSETKLRNAFLNKYISGVMTDVVEFRKVGRMIKTGIKEGHAAERARDAFTQLVTEEEVSVDEAYNASAAAGFEMKRLLRDIRGLPDRINELLEKTDLLPEQKKRFHSSLEELRDYLTTMLPQH